MLTYRWLVQANHLFSFSRLVLTNHEGEGRKMTLRELKVGKSGRVLAIGGEKALRHRLMEMGVTPRTVVTVKKIAPMGDPLEILLRGYVLTLRLEDAEKISVEEVTI